MGCVMLHMELLRDLLSPQSRVHLTESPVEGVQLEGLHWQAITDVKEAEGLLQQHGGVNVAQPLAAEVEAMLQQPGIMEQARQVAEQNYESYRLAAIQILKRNFMLKIKFFQKVAEDY